MLRLLIVSISILYSCITLAQSSYQVDLIIFAYPQSGDKSNSLAMTSPLLPISQNAIALRSNSRKAYGLLANSKSSLQDQYYLLSRKSNYKVLGHYSWIQPAANQSSVALPKLSHNGWQMQGTLRVRQNSYYLFDARLQLSPPNHPESYFTVTQDQRLKGGVVYFLDHPQVGMLVKIHKPA
ncbi:CsiV family protein [Legionella fallonii]|uniref:Lipoprotein n=1 Tax=Legionella fallonii LLAP-10 TaxID=1212491 RepID=A0A098G4C7_9GAMM|nr:CsiV family protein [Legionella fallonii]CEG57348.1 conserved exported protein of unknown function [Legionella fallonii LLAP-10]